MKIPVLVAVPVGVVTLIGPACASAGTAARIDVDERIVGVTGAAPLKPTALAAPSASPLIVTRPPTDALIGVNVVIAGRIPCRAFSTLMRP